jgi:hypothetical protein
LCRRVSGQEALAGDAATGSGVVGIQSSGRELDRNHYTLKVGSLRNSASPRWLKGFKSYMRTHSHYDNVHLRLHLKKKMEQSYQDLSRSKVPKPKARDDVVTLADAWLEKAVEKGSVQPILGAEQTLWWKALPDKCKGLALRDREGKAFRNYTSASALRSSSNYVWAVPYKWGCLCMLTRQDKLNTLEHVKLRDWSDLWHSSLKGKIALPNSPRLLVEITLRSFGRDFNAETLFRDSKQQDVFQQRLKQLKNQVKTFNMQDALKSMKSPVSLSSLGNQIYVTIGWSHTLVPYSQKSNFLKAVVPRSGTLLSADCWCVPHYASITSVSSTLVDEWFAYTTGVGSSLPANNFLGLKRGSADISLMAHLIHQASDDDSSSSFGGENGSMHCLDAMDMSNNFTPHPWCIQRSEFLLPWKDQTLAQYKKLNLN